MKKNITVLEKTGRRNKNKISTFFLTINTNSTDLVSKSFLKKIASKFFEHLEDYICFLNKSQGKDFIDSIDIQDGSHRKRRG